MAEDEVIEIEPEGNVVLMEKPDAANDSNGVIMAEATATPVAVVAEEATPAAGRAASKSRIALQTVGWWRQFIYALRKNGLLLWRRPISLTAMMLSSIVSVLLAWLAGQDPSVDFGNVPLTDCGTIPYDYYQSLSYPEQDALPLSYNDKWQNGLAVSLICMGPMMLAIFSFLLVHIEMETKLLGILRALGLRESVFWMSWWIPMIGISAVNALLGAITAKICDVHVFQHVYFLGIWLSIVCLNLALVATSFFLASVCGTSRRGAPWLIVCILVAAWLPFILVSTISWIPWDAGEAIQNHLGISPYGLFWTYTDTTSVNRFYTNWTTGEYEDVECDEPLLTEAEGNFFKTEEQRLQVSEDSYFMGCYAGAGYVNHFWSNPMRGPFATFILYLIPYTHFLNIWAEFLGYTSMPDRSFGIAQASMTAEALAIEALPAPPNPDNSKGTTLFPQGSILNVDSPYDENSYFDQNGYYQPRYNCPAANLSEHFCTSLNQCNAAPNPSPTETPSVHQMLGCLLSLVVFYTLFAAYWAQLFPGPGNGAPKKFYFFLLPSYWVGTRFSEADVEDMGAAGVVVEEVRKSYKDCEALKGVSLRMETGEVTALLGHNGAGKTTLSHVLCCETPPTDGDVKVFGYSVKEDPYAVRRLVGLCKQDNYLYPDLSAKEHLELFAGLRGVSSESIPQMVQKWLESVDLDVVQDQFTTGYSGGMKRRLSLACSTIGDRPLIILDEPTTGIDPVNRRFVWKHIDEIKEGRVVLLTTHAMEEADLLSDVVAIMRKGELAAFGTPLQLKTEHGSALQFNILVKREDTQTTQTAILDRFASSRGWLKLDAGDNGNITVTIAKIQRGSETEGVDVDELAAFVGWLDSKDSPVEEYGFSNSSLEEVFLKVTEGDVEEHGTSVVAEEIGTESFVGAQAQPAANDVSSFKPILSVQRQTEALLRFFLARNWMGRGSITNWILFGVLLVSVVLTSVRAAGFWNPLTFLVMPVSVISLMLVTVVSPIYVDRRFRLLYLMRAQGLLGKSYILAHGVHAFVATFVFGLVMLSLIYATPLFRDPIICQTCETYPCAPCFWELGDPPVEDYPGSISWWEDIYDGRSVTISGTPAPGGYGLLVGAISIFSLTMPGALFSSAYFPGYKFAMVLLVFLILIASMVPLIIYLIGTATMTEIELAACVRDVCDAELSSFNIENLGTTGKSFLDCVGASVHQSTSLGGLCAPPTASLLPQVGFFQMLSMAMISEIILTSDPPEYIEQVLIPAMGGDISCSGSKCTFPFARELYLKNVGFTIVSAELLLVIGLLQVWIFTFPSKTILQCKHAIARALCSFRCSWRGGGESGSTDESQDEPPLEEVVEETELVSELIKPLTRGVHTPSDLEEGVEQTNLAHEAIPRDEVPPVLVQELRKVYPPLGGLPPKVALASLDLHVPKGQVLGLLGKNGAGKTTALKILSLEHDATAGHALVAGYDVSCEQLKVFERLGSCPQFDVVWPSQSVQRHLEFIARLKGLPRNSIREVALAIATAVGLGAPEVFTRRASSLSGGMRRRLSIAISLIGAPSVLLLDEPATGLDPSTRNSIWGLISSFATEDRAIIITTHMMVEADTLCNRIAIMSQGRLKVVATQQALKDRFGSGYLLQLNLVKSGHESQESAMAFVRNRLHKDAVLQTKQAKTLHVALPRDLDLKKVFRTMYSDETASVGMINQFLLSQSSLEDVFLALGE